LLICAKEHLQYSIAVQAKPRMKEDAALLYLMSTRTKQITTTVHTGYKIVNIYPRTHIILYVGHSSLVLMSNFRVIIFTSWTFGFVDLPIHFRDPLG
jgi:hypothetical protein